MPNETTFAAVPHAPPTTPGALPGLPPYSFAGAWSAGWRSFTDRYGLLLGATLLACLIMGAVSVFGSIIDEMLGFRGDTVKPVSSVLGWLVSPVAVGAMYVAAAVARRDKVNIEHVFLGFGRYPTLLCISLVSSVAWMLFSAVSATIASGGAGTMLLLIPAAVVLLIVAVFVSIRLYFAGVVAIDPRGPRPGIADALNLSWSMTSGIALSLFGLAVVVALVMIATAAMLFVPLFFVGLPVMFAVSGAAYALRAEETGITEPA